MRLTRGKAIDFRCERFGLFGREGAVRRFTLLFAAHLIRQRQARYHENIGSAALHGTFQNFSHIHYTPPFLPEVQGVIRLPARSAAPFCNLIAAVYLI